VCNMGESKYFALRAGASVVESVRVVRRLVVG
jgi:hypothetical protein